MKKAIVFLANGFEEMEATGTVDILRRGGIDTKTVSITDDRKVIGAHNMEYTADATFTEIDLSDADALILPGGMPGASNLNNSEPVKEVLLQQYREGRIVAAICAAPGMPPGKIKASASERSISVNVASAVYSIL